MIYPNQLHSYSSVGEVGMLLIIADMDSIGEFQEELTYYDMESPCFQKSMLSRYGQMVLDILADIGLHKELRPFRQDKGLLMALLADMYENIPVIKKDKPSDLNITQKLLQYINDNITGELTAQKVAKSWVLVRIICPIFFLPVKYLFSFLCSAAADDPGLQSVEGQQKDGDRDQLRMRIS